MTEETFEFFDYADFACPCCGKNKIDIPFVRKLDKARRISGTSFSINSGYRCEKHNTEVGSTSDNHTSGHGGDIWCKEGPKRIMIIEGLILAGFRRIGIHLTFIHADDMDKVESLWLYK